MQETIVLKNLIRKFGSIKAVDDISITAYQGDIIGLIGTNGAGKTIVLQTLAGCLQPTAGIINICGFNINDNPIKVKQKIGYLPEKTIDYGNMTTTSFLSFISKIRNIPKKERKNIIEKIVISNNLKDVLHIPIKKLSNGFQKRISLAQATIHNPEILLLDEPFLGLDANQKGCLQSFIKTNSTDKTIIIASNVLEEIEAVCSRIIIMEKGKIIANDTLDNILAKSRYRNATTVRIPIKNFEKAKNALQKMVEVDEIKENILQNDVDLTIFSKDGQMIAPKVLICLKNNLINVKSFFTSNGNLEDFFRTLTTKSK